MSLAVAVVLTLALAGGALPEGLASASVATTHAAAAAPGGKSKGKAKSHPKPKPKGKSKKTKKAKGKPKPKAKSRGHGKKKKKTKPAPKPKGKSKKQGALPDVSFTANPGRVGPVPPKGCSLLKVVATFPSQHGTTTPYHPGPSTQPVLFKTDFGTLTPAATKFDANGKASATLCSAVPGTATVTLSIPTFAPHQFAKQCKQTNKSLCKPGNGPPKPKTVTVVFFGKNPKPGGGAPGGGAPGGAPGTGGTGGTNPADEPPTAAFSFSPNNPPAAPKPGQTVSFDGTGSSDPDGTIKAWSWKFDGPKYGGGGMVNTVSGANGPMPATSFSAPGAYPVTLTVTDSDGQTASVTHIVFVSGPGSKMGVFTTDANDPLGCSGTILATVDIFVPTYAQISDLMSAVVRGAATGGCAGATITITKIFRTTSDAPPDAMGNPRLDEWGNVKDTINIKFTISGGTSAQGAVPFTVSWQ